MDTAPKEHLCDSEADLGRLQLCERIAQIIPGSAFSEAAAGQDQDQPDYLVSGEKLERNGWMPKVDLNIGAWELI
jgi:hypothetical protein